MKLQLNMTADSHGLNVDEYQDYLEDRRAILRAISADECYSLIHTITNDLCNKHALESYKDAYELAERIFEALNDSNVDLEGLYV